MTTFADADETQHDKIQTCPICGCDLEWEDCWNGCVDGYFDGYDDDPLWYDPGDLVSCSECGGRGGYLVCPNAERHDHNKDDEP